MNLVRNKISDGWQYRYCRSFASLTQRVKDSQAFLIENAAFLKFFFLLRGNETSGLCCCWQYSGTIVSQRILEESRGASADLGRNHTVVFGYNRKDCFTWDGSNYREGMRD
jgi:hypothetical protein